MKYKVCTELFLLFAVLVSATLGNSQSLSDLARQEAERRKLLEGVEGKTIRDVEARQSSSSNAAASSPAPDSGPISEKKSSSKSGTSLKIYRAAIEKLDREIRQSREKLATLRERLADLRWAPPKTGKLASSSSAEASLEKLRAQIEDLEIKLKQIERERLEIYDQGRKEGYLPGELDGKGIVP